jgi:hypothetical protein
VPGLVQTVPVTALGFTALFPRLRMSDSSAGMASPKAAVAERRTAKRVEVYIFAIAEIREYIIC